MSSNVHVRELLPTVFFRRWHVWLHKSCTFDTNNNATIGRNQKPLIILLLQYNSFQFGAFWVERGHRWTEARALTV